MADDHMYIAHRPCGLAVFAGKMFGIDWRDHVLGDAFQRLNRYIEENNLPERAGYFNRRPEGVVVEPFVLLYEGPSNKSGFDVQWTTPSGQLIPDEDYVDKAAGIFRVVFLTYCPATCLRCAVQP